MKLEFKQLKRVKVLVKLDFFVLFIVMFIAYFDY